MLGGDRDGGPPAVRELGLLRTLGDRGAGEADRRRREQLGEDVCGQCARGGPGGFVGGDAHQLLQRDGERVVGHRDGVHRPPVRPVLPFPVQPPGLHEQVEAGGVVVERARARDDRAVQQHDVGAPPDARRSAGRVEGERGHADDQVAVVDEGRTPGTRGQRRVPDDGDGARRVVAGIVAHQVGQDLSAPLNSRCARGRHRAGR